MNTSPSPTEQRLSKDEIRLHLTRARERTTQIMSLIPEECWHKRYHEFYSPVGWHFGHVGRTEEHWTCVRAMGKEPHNPDLDFLYNDIPENPKDSRVRVPDHKETLDYLKSSRERCLEALEEADFDSDNPLERNGFAWVFAFKHEYQHQETIAEMMHMFPIDLCTPDGFSGHVLDVEMAPYNWLKPEVGNLVRIPGGTFQMGSDKLYGYDNEYQQHEVTVESFDLMDRPVTFWEFHEFVLEGGYRDKSLWSEFGIDWMEFEGIHCPEFYANWHPDDLKRAKDWEPIVLGPHGARSPDPAEPIMGISYYEAEAYAKWRGLRLPTEAEWEYAATASRGEKTLYPWGNQPPSPDLADFGLSYWGPKPSGHFPKGANAHGVLGLAGGVWEWTSTTFGPYPGFKPFPYEGYSQAHFNTKEEATYQEDIAQNTVFKVCRGGSWATGAANLYGTFRNWYPRGYRAGFIGLRLAR